ncbi:hypothetical protein ABN028_25220 [Actinopolymorpha sp. B17G11]
MGEELSQEEINEMQPDSAADISEFAELTKDAEIVGTTDSTRFPGTTGVSLRTPEGEATLAFLEQDGAWYYVGAEGGQSGGSSSGGSGGS